MVFVFESIFLLSFRICGWMWQMSDTRMFAISWPSFPGDSSFSTPLPFSLFSFLAFFYEHKHMHASQREDFSQWSCTEHRTCVGYIAFPSIVFRRLCICRKLRLLFFFLDKHIYTILRFVAQTSDVF